MSQKMCNQYYDDRLQLYGINLGKKALPREFPHMAAIGYGKDKAKISWLCGGSLISPDFVLNAAHCVHSTNYGPAKWIRLGDLDLQNTTEDANPQDLAIRTVYIHPSYKVSSHYHDIALFKLERKIIFQRHVKTACLQIEQKLPVDILEVTGWGQLGFFGKTSSHLMKAKLEVIDQSTCAKRYQSNRKLSNGILDKYQICAGDATGRDTCPGDSGGPLHYLVRRNGKIAQHFVVAGITSFGKGCGGEYSAAVYTRVSFYVGWIESIVWREDTV